MGKRYAILKRILNNLESSTLPTATPQDKDKVATVDENGAWQAKQPSGGSGNGPLIVTATSTLVDDVDVITLDKTYNEIAAAMFSSGAYILYDWSDEDDGIVEYEVLIIKKFGSGHKANGEPVYYVVGEYEYENSYGFSSSSADGVLGCDNGGSTPK